MPCCASLAGLFDTAQARDGVVGVLGNHDHYYPAEKLRRELAEHTPVRLIENTAFLLERGGQHIAIGGVGDLWRGKLEPEKRLPLFPTIFPACWFRTTLILPNALILLFILT